MGYRHFDTAYLYGNEIEVGSAIREKIADGTVNRDEIFIVTKVGYALPFLTCHNLKICYALSHIKAMEYSSRTRKSGGSVPQKLDQPWPRIYRFVFNALPERFRRT